MVLKHATILSVTFLSKLDHLPRFSLNDEKSEFINPHQTPQTLTPNPLIANVNTKSSELTVSACIFNQRLEYQNDQ